MWMDTHHNILSCRAWNKEQRTPNSTGPSLTQRIMTGKYVRT